MSKKEKNELNLNGFKEFFKKDIVKISLKSITSEIKNIDEVLYDKSKMGLIDESYTDKSVRVEVLKKFDVLSDDISIQLTTPVKIAEGKKNIIAVNEEEASTIDLIYDINLWDSPEPIFCTVTNNDKKCNAILKMTPKLSPSNNFVLISKALSNMLEIGNKDEIAIGNVRFNFKRINLDKLSNITSDLNINY